jgi:hypothetical protein
MDTLSKELIKKIKNNISRSNNKDVQEHRPKGTLTIEEFFDKIKEQGNKCYVCLQEFKFDGGKWCYFFPSADRIYNYSSHTKDNIAASCLFCNIRMFKKVNEKKCGLCDGLNHHYQGEIITKSKLFRNLGNCNDNIKKYINEINKTPEEIENKRKEEFARDERIRLSLEEYFSKKDSIISNT